MKLFLEEGAGSVTVEKIAEAADLARATVYNHFRGLEGVVTELAGPVLDSGIEALKNINGKGSPLTIGDILSALYLLWKNNREPFLLVCMNMFPLRDSLERKHGEFVSLFISLLQGVKEAGRFRIPDPTATARLVFLTFPHVLKAVAATADPESLFISCMRGMVVSEA